MRTRKEMMEEVLELTKKHNAIIREKDRIMEEETSVEKIHRLVLLLKEAHSVTYRMAQIAEEAKAYRKSAESSDWMIKNDDWPQEWPRPKDEKGI